MPGALAQGLVATPLGMAVGWSLGWSAGAGLIFGVALSVASTVVLLRVLQERRLIETERGRITVGWLIVQDIAMVLVLVLLPGLTALFHGMETAPGAVEIVRSITILLGKFAIFIAVMLLVGKKLIPAILHYVAHTGSRELFRLAVLSIALGCRLRRGGAVRRLARARRLLRRHDAERVAIEPAGRDRVAAVARRLRRAVLRLGRHAVRSGDRLLAAPLALLATVLIILIGKSVVAFFVVRLFGHSRSTALMISASLAQIGEFSFILADRSLALGLLPEDGRDLILAGAIISILVNPLLFAALDLYAARREKALAEAAAADAREEEVPMREPIRPTTLRNHVVLVGHGRVGSFISSVLGEQSVPLFVIEDDEDGVAALRQEGIEALEGNAADPAVIEAANLPEARCLLVAIPDAFEGGQVVQQAHAINPSLPIIARAHSEEEIDYLKRHGATLVVMGEHEIAKAMLDNVAQIALLVAQSSREAAAVQPESMPVEKAASTG